MVISFKILPYDDIQRKYDIKKSVKYAMVILTPHLKLTFRSI